MAMNECTRLVDVNDAPELAAAKGHLISGGDFFSGEKGEMTLRQLSMANPTWNCDDMLYGLARLQKIAKRGKPYSIPVFAESEIRENPRLAQVQLLYMPADAKTHNSVAILLAGGAYGAVCTMVESLPVAARLNELGVSCFCLNYRTATAESMEKGLLPEPLDDLAAAWRLIEHKQDDFGVDASNYIVGGFSAGGHTASLWGTEHLGARKYDISQPQMLMLGYPLITMENVPDSPIKQYLCNGMFGAEYTLDMIRQYDASRHIDALYPKVYLACSLDDTTVSPKDSDALSTAMKAAGVPLKMERAASGGHGFGLGSATPLDGWVKRALAFHVGEDS